MLCIPLSLAPSMAASLERMSQVILLKRRRKCCKTGFGTRKCWILSLPITATRPKKSCGNRQEAHDAKLANAGVLYRRQFAFASLDLALHDPHPEEMPYDSVAISNPILEKVFLPIDPSTTFVSYFGHLNGTMPVTTGTPGRTQLPPIWQPFLKRQRTVTSINRPE